MLATSIIDISLWVSSLIASCQPITILSHCSREQEVHLRFFLEFETTSSLGFAWSFWSGDARWTTLKVRLSQRKWPFSPSRLLCRVSFPAVSLNSKRKFHYFESFLLRLDINEVLLKLSNKILYKLTITLLIIN